MGQTENRMRLEYWQSDCASLIFVDDQRYSDGYGGTYRKAVRISDLKKYQAKVRSDPRTHFLTIRCEWRGRTIAMSDCDSPESAKQTIDYLEERGLNYALFQSSLMKSWVFPGLSFSSFEAAHNFLKCIPGCDHRYVMMAKDKGHFIVRGEAKESEAKSRGIFGQPRLVKSSVKDPAVKAFTEALKVHFESLELKDLTRTRLTCGGWPEGKAVYGCWSQEQEREFMEEVVRGTPSQTRNQYEIFSGSNKVAYLDDDDGDGDDFFRKLREL